MKIRYLASILPLVGCGFTFGGARVVIGPADDQMHDMPAEDAGNATAADAAVSETSVPADSGATSDASNADASAADTGNADSGIIADASSDDSTADSGVADASASDSATSADASDAGNADSGVIGTDAADAGAADSGAIEATAIVLRYDGPVSGPAHMGSRGQHLLITTMSFQRTVEVRELNFRFDAVDDGHFLSDALGNTFIQNVRLMDIDTGEVVMGPVALVTGANARTASIRLADPLAGITGTARRLALTVDIRNLPGSALVGTRFRVSEDSGDGRYFTTTAVRDIAAGTYVSPAAITNNLPFVGNIFTVTQSSLALDLASNPRSSVVTRNAINVDSAGIVLTAGPDRDVLVTGLHLHGVGNVGGGFFRGDLQQVVTGCGLFDGTTLVGTVQTPDSTGFMSYTPNYTVTRGTSRVLVVKCTTDSVVRVPSGDLYAIGVSGRVDVDAQDSDGVTPTVTVSDALVNQLTTPSVFQTVVESGTLHVTLASPATIHDILGGDDAWHVVSSYTLTSTVEPMQLVYGAVQWTGPNSCISQLAIASDGVSHGTNYPVAGRADRDIDLHAYPILVTPAGVNVQVWARFNPVQDASAGPDACIPNSTLTFGLAAGLTTGEWSDAYGVPALRYNLRTLGIVSGESVIANDATLTGGYVELH